MRIEMRFVVPLDEYGLAIEDWIIHLLSSYGIGTEDIMLIAMQHQIQHIVPVEEEWFSANLEISPVAAAWEQMNGNRGCTSTLPGLLATFTTTVYKIYRIYFQYMQAIFKHYGVDIDIANQHGNLRIKQIKWIDRATLEFMLYFDPPITQVDRV